MSTPEQLFEELVGRWSRGEPLAVDELLVLAGDQSEELAVLVDAFLARAPRREPTPDALAFVRSLDDPPLLRARKARLLKLDDLTSGLVEKLGLPTSARAKVRRYYQDLELGNLDSAGVAASVWDALSGLLGRDARGLAGARPAPQPAPAMLRTADYGADPAPMAIAQSRPAETEPDEVDRLFGVRPSD